MRSLVSIVIASYNRAHILPRTLLSVLAQTERNIEVIIVDDGSTDDTPRIVSAVDDQRVRYIRLEKNGGASAARNRGIQEAKGEFVMVWDSDDVLYPAATQTLADVFTVHPECVVVSAPARMMRKGKEMGAVSLPDGCVTLPQVLCKAVGNNEKVRLVRREAYLRAPYIARNIDFIVAARLRAQGDWYHLHEPLGEVALDNADSLTHARKKFDMRRSAERAPHLDSFMEDFGPLLKRSCAGRYGQLAYGTSVACSCAGKRREGIRYATKAVRSMPLSPRPYAALLFSLFFTNHRA